MKDHILINVSKYNRIKTILNALLNGFNILLSKVQCYDSGDNNMIAKYTNILKINQQMKACKRFL